MRNFIIIFSGKEGTSPLVRLLNNLEKISILHHVNNRGWEPFDRHNCGRMSLKDLRTCLDIIYQEGEIDYHALNKIYTKTAAHPIDEVDYTGIIGFKMRFVSPARFISVKRWQIFKRIYGNYHFKIFKKMMINILRRHNVVVFMVVRQDIFRWGLSKYHGDGTGKSGHLQFKLASGKLSRDKIGKVFVDPEKLNRIISDREALHAAKRRLLIEFKKNGIQTYPLLYEDFLNDRKLVVKYIAKCLEMDLTEAEIDCALQKGEYYKKVHSDDISEFVENHEEIKNKFGDRYISWR